MPKPQLPGLKPASIKPLLLSRIRESREAIQAGRDWREEKPEPNPKPPPDDPTSLEQARKRVAESSIWKPAEKDYAIARLTMELAKAGQREEARQLYEKIRQEEHRALALRYLAYLEAANGNRAFEQIDREKSATVKVYGWTGIAQALLGWARPEMYFMDESGWRAVFDDL